MFRSRIRASLLAALPLLPLLGPAARGQCEAYEFAGADQELNDNFGDACAVSGIWMVAGARYVDDLGTRSGAAYFFRLENGQMVERDKVLASNGETDDEFGIEVDIDGNVAVVGARFGNGLAVDSGAAYVFRRSGTQWNQEALLQASDGELDDGFGISVAVDGDRILVGAFLEDQGGSSAGAAYVFDYNGVAWSQSDKIVPGSVAQADEFGRSVALEGDRAVIGSPFDDDDGNASGSAYVYEKSGAVWLQKAHLKATDAHSESLFGYSVDLSGNRAVIGAPGADGALSDSGAAYAFIELAIGPWTQVAKLVASNGDMDDNFGIAVAFDGDHTVVGADFATPFGTASGAAYVYGTPAGPWNELAILEASDGGYGERFGEDVDLDGDTILIGARDAGTLVDGSGSAYVFLLDGNDCNMNGLPDVCDIWSGASADANGNAIPDECECVVLNYCTSGPNSTGSAAGISYSGSLGVAADTFTLNAAPVPDQTGLFFYGPGPFVLPFGNGFLCVFGPYQRLPVEFASGGQLQHAVDFTMPPTPAGQITAFSTWYFQAWFRDPAAGGAFFDLSDGLQVTFCP